MIDPIFFDTDCICAFLWVEEQSLLERMYPGRIFLPREVYNEMKNPRTPHLKARIDQMITRKSVNVIDMEIGSEEYKLFYTLTKMKTEGYSKVIGKGEAAAIALTKKYNGILGSNNLNDVEYYVKKYSLEHMTTGDIMVQALDKGHITYAQGETIWAEMIKRKRKIGAPTFGDFLKNQ